MSIGPPIAFIKSMEADTINSPASDFVSRLQTSAEVFAADVNNKAEFSNAIARWYTNNTNPQYLFLVVHGFPDDAGRAIGIAAGDELITWKQFWTEVVTSVQKPPNIIIMGCRSSDAIQCWNQLIQADINTPYLVGYSGIVTTFGQNRLIYRVICLLSSFLHTQAYSTLDEDVSRLAHLTTDVSYHLPVILRGITPYFATPNEIYNNHSLSVRQLLELSAGQWAEDHPSYY